MFSRPIKLLSSKTVLNTTLLKGIHKNFNLEFSCQAVPIQIDVPWGKIDGKLWGSPDKQPILALHGWMDNAGTFDLIAPQLLKSSSILAIDLPGHGLSSWLPPGVPYFQDIMTEAMRLVVKNFGWNKVKLLGHSMGGTLCLNYASLYPDEVEFVVQIDSFAPFTFNMLKHSKDRAKAIDKFINFEKKITADPPSYPEEVAMQKWIDSTVFRSLDAPSTKILMIRGTKKKPDGTCYYTRDFRLSIGGFYSRYSPEDVKQMLCLITCPYMIIKASKTKFELKRPGYWEGTQFLQESSEDFRLVNLEGAHHLHLTNSEMVANEIIPFLEKHDK